MIKISIPFFLLVALSSFTWHVVISPSFLPTFHCFNPAPSSPHLFFLQQLCSAIPFPFHFSLHALFLNFISTSIKSIYIHLPVSARPSLSVPCTSLLFLFPFLVIFLSCCCFCCVTVCSSDGTMKLFVVWCYQTDAYNFVRCFLISIYPEKGLYKGPKLFFRCMPTFRNTTETCEFI